MGFIDGARGISTGDLFFVGRIGPNQDPNDWPLRLPLENTPPSNLNETVGLLENLSVQVIAATGLSENVPLTEAVIAYPPCKAIRFGAGAGADGLVSSNPPTFNLHTVCMWLRLRVTNVGSGRQMCSSSIEAAAPDVGGPYQLLFESTFNANTWETHDSVQGGFLFSPTVNVGDWWFVATTNDFSGAGTVMYARKDGDLTTISPITGNSHPTMTGATRHLIGIDDAGAQYEWLDGDICGVKTWDAALSQTEIDAESRQLDPVRTANLHAYYPFQDLSTKLNDSSGNGNTLAQFTAPGGTPSYSLRTDGPLIPVNTSSSQTFNANLSETVTLSEAVAAQLVVQLALSETDTLSESLAVQTIDSVALSDSAIVVSDQVAQFIALPVPLSETVTGPGESLATQFNAVVPLSETDTLSEAISPAATFNVTGLAETETLTDSLQAGLLFSAQLSETVTGPGESLAAQADFVAALSETDTLGEALSSQALFTQGLSETVSLSEALQAGLLFQLSLSENVGAVGEALAVIYQAIPAPAETVTLSESLATQALFTVGPNETVPLSEALSAGLVFQLALSENIGALGEALTVVLAAAPALSETVTLGEAVSSQAVYQVGPIENVVLSESLSAGQVFQLALSETVTLAEAIAVAKAFVVGLNETVAIAEAVAAAATYAAGVTENVALAEAVANQIAAIVDLAESAIAIGESLNAHQGQIYNADVSETVTITEQVVLTVFARTYELVAMFSPGEFNEAIVLVPGQTSATVINNGVTKCVVQNDGITTTKVIS